MCMVSVYGMCMVSVYGMCMVSVYGILCLFVGCVFSRVTSVCLCVCLCMRLCLCLYLHYDSRGVLFRWACIHLHSSAFICIHLRDERSCVSVSVSVSSSESVSVSLFIYQGSTRIFRP